MSHIIQPIAIGGTKYCVKHGAFYAGMDHRWRTISILSVGEPEAALTLAAGEDDDSWLFDNSEDPTGFSPQSNAEVNFGVSCISEISVSFDLIDPAFGDFVDIKILFYPPSGGVIELSSSFLSADGLSSEVLTATGLDGSNPFLSGWSRSCGGVIGLRVDVASHDGFVGITVIDVS
jgi:hypothetical protein